MELGFARQRTFKDLEWLLNGFWWLLVAFVWPRVAFEWLLKVSEWLLFFFIFRFDDAFNFLVLDKTHPTPIRFQTNSDKRNFERLEFNLVDFEHATTFHFLSCKQIELQLAIVLGITIELHICILRRIWCMASRFGLINKSLSYHAD